MLTLGVVECERDVSVHRQLIAVHADWIARRSRARIRPHGVVFREGHKVEDLVVDSDVVLQDLGGNKEQVQKRKSDQTEKRICISFA